MILAIQRLRAMEGQGGALLARWTVGFYVITTVFSIILSVIMTALVWSPRFTPVSEEELAVSDDAEYPDPEDRPWYSVVDTLFKSFIPANIIQALADNELLSILITAVVIGYLIRDANSTLLKLVAEIESMVTRVVAFIIKLAPIGVFFLILPNLMKLDMTSIGENLGLLIGGTLSTMAIHVFIVLPALFFGFTRKNPYSHWLKISPAWITAWGCASSAATLPVTLRVARERGIPKTIYKFTCPLGCLINMDGLVSILVHGTLWINLN
jgi:Na+/H+-dicarboxylate symporter